MKKSVLWFLGFIFIFSLISMGEESLFKPELASSPQAQKIFSFIEKNKEKVIEEWIFLTEIPAPSGHEEKRAQYIKSQFEKAKLDEAYIDETGNAIGIWKGTKHKKRIILAAHMDTVFKGVDEINVIREGNILKAPGIGDDTASCINLLWTIRSLKHAGFEPENDYYFLGTVGEETGFDGIRFFLDNNQQKFDILIALDGNLGGISYGALGFGGGRITFRGPGAHTMRSRGVPNPNLAVAKAIDQIYQLSVPAEPLEKFVVYNVGIIGGGKVNNAVSQESFFTVDLRSADQEELNKAQKQIEAICHNVAEQVGVEVEIKLNKNSKAAQLPGARNSSLVRTAEEILKFLKVEDIRITPLGSTDANPGISRGIPSINLGRTYCRYGHSLREEAEIDGLFVGMKQDILMILSIN
ncbi:M20 family metallopeptidase [Acidobacteriota bacterium]